MTEKEKMLSGQLYDPTDPELVQLREKAHILSKRYNDTVETQEDERKEIMAERDAAKAEQDAVKDEHDPQEDAEESDKEEK